MDCFGRTIDLTSLINKPLSNQNLITWKDTPVYNAPSAGSAPFGVLADNLRYPILHKLKDRLNQTWYQIRIGDRLAYISALDAQPDNGLPVLTYHHILRDEENTRFRHTSTTTSVRAFNNQMAWLRDRGYATLSMAQLEGYVKNKINLFLRLQERRNQLFLFALHTLIVLFLIAQKCFQNRQNHP